MNKRDVNTFAEKKSYIKKKEIDRLQYAAKSLVKKSRQLTHSNNFGNTTVQSTLL